MNKSTKGMLLAAGVIGSVFGIALLYLKFSPPLETESLADRRLAEMRRLKGMVLGWNTLDAAARRAALPDLPKGWQFADDELRWNATLVLGHAGPEALPIL